MISLPKLPSIRIEGNVEKDTKNKILMTKIGGMPYIPNDMEYLTDENNVPMICIAQLNFSQIFNLIDTNLNTQNLDEFTKYFSCMPKTGILQIYLEYSEELFDDHAILQYIPEYSLEKHNKKKESELRKHYKKYYDKHGSLANAFNETIYISNAEYEYNNLNNTNQSHPQYEEFFENSDCSDGSDCSDHDYNNSDDTKKKYDECARIGGYPYHLQDDMGFDDKSEIILFSYCNSYTGLNISVNQKDIEKLDFTNCGFDLSY
jgi:uncharacterized protein YwqG